MQMLLHCCCGPCSVYPIQYLLDTDIKPTLLWFNPNIHPEFEWNRRRDNLKLVADYYHLDLSLDDSFMQEYWEKKEYLSQYDSRCLMCYDIRMDYAAKFASENGFDSFTTSLLVSPYQQHDIIREICQRKSRKYDVEFKYYDFRPGFREGQNKAREIGLYRQKYCGCIFSLEESEFKDKIIRSFEV